MSAQGGGREKGVKNSHGKWAVSRHTDQSKATCDRLERTVERQTRRIITNEELQERAEASHAARFPNGCRATWATMCEHCCERIGGLP